MNECQHYGRVMSHREEWEQGQCNDCLTMATYYASGEDVDFSAELDREV